MAGWRSSLFGYFCVRPMNELIVNLIIFQISRILLITLFNQVLNTEFLRDLLIHCLKRNSHIRSR